MKKTITLNLLLDYIITVCKYIRKYFVIEPLLILWILPACFNYVAIQNLGLEKACRVNLKFNQEVCDNMLDKTLNDIDCDSATFDSSMDIDGLQYLNMTAKSLNFTSVVCSAEINTQKLVTVSNGIRGPIASIFPIIVILFAGSWSDRHNLRKPCMLFPMIGEALTTTAFLLSSIFFDALPMEFGTILEKILPSLFGGQTLMIMGIFSYLAATTEESDRTFRFGIFGMVAAIIPLVGLPFSGTLYLALGYIKIFALGLILLLLGILYLIFFVNEVTETLPNEAVAEGSDPKTLQITENGTKTVEPIAKKSCLREFFDPVQAFECIKVLLKKRPNHVQTFLILLLVSYGLFIGPQLAEIDYLYQYTKIKLKWDEEEFSVFNGYSSAITLVGTFLMTTVISKLMKISDSMLGFVSAVCTIISRPLYAFAKDKIAYYAGQTVDMFVTPKTIAVKTLVSIIVEPEEIGRVFSLLGIFEAIGGVIFPPLYSYVYVNTIDSFTGAFYLLGEIFYIPNAILFGVCYFLLKPNDAADKTDIEKNNSANAPEKPTESTETETVSPTHEVSYF